MVAALALEIVCVSGYSSCANKGNSSRVAQLAEQLAVNQQVVGSRPTPGAFFSGSGDRSPSCHKNQEISLVDHKIPCCQGVLFLQILILVRARITRGSDCMVIWLNELFNA